MSSGWWGRGGFSRDSAPDPGGQTGNTQDKGEGDAGREKGKGGAGFPSPPRVWVRKGVLHGCHILKQPRPTSRFRASPSSSRLQLPIPTKTDIQSGLGELLREAPGGRQRGARDWEGRRRRRLGGVGGRRSRLLRRLAQPRCLPLQATAARAGKPKGLLPAGSQRGGGGGEGASPCPR